MMNGAYRRLGFFVDLCEGAHLDVCACLCLCVCVCVPVSVCFLVPAYQSESQIASPTLTPFFCGRTHTKGPHLRDLRVFSGAIAATSTSQAVFDWSGREEDRPLDWSAQTPLTRTYGVSFPSRDKFRQWKRTHQQKDGVRESVCECE